MASPPRSRQDDYRRSPLAGAIYGTLAVGTLLAVESAQNETYGETLGAVLISLVLYWMAHAYAEFTSWRIRQSRPLTLRGLIMAMTEWSLIPAGAALPLIALLIAWAAGAQLDAAVSAGVWTAFATLVLIELTASLRARRSVPQLLLQTALGSVLGLGIVALRILLH